ncbi:hypothetical protein BD779DRAFT_783985 [Infundibulicybe gibba]|nr:hypothetical protein BD779DRAFT_783985 [Infundibulicybe gibba]
MLYAYLSIKWPGLSASQNAHPTPMFCFTAFIFVTVTIHWILSIVRIFQAFIMTDGRNPSGVLDDLSQPTAILGVVMLMVLILARDLTAMYRVWVIFDYHKGSIVAPMMMLATLVGFVVAFVSQPVKNAKNAAMLIGVFATTFGINIYCTALITCQMWRTQQSTLNRGLSPRFSFIIVAMIESLALSSAWGALILLSYKAMPGVFSLAFDVQSPVIGIAFIIVQVRVGMRRLYINNSQKSLDE